MPVNYRNKRKPKYGRRRTYRKKYGRRRRYDNSQVGLMPNSIVRKMRYFHTFTTAPGIQPYYPFRANGPGDPGELLDDQTPMGYTTASQFYNHYTVISAKVNLTATWTSTPGVPAFVGISLRTNQTLDTTDDYIEEPRNVYAVLTAGSQDDRVKLSKTYNAKRFFNVSNLKQADNLRSSTGIAVPTEQAFFHLWSASTNGTGSSVNAMNWSVQIDYVILFTDPRNITQLLKQITPKPSDDHSVILPRSLAGSDDEYETVRIRKGSIQPQ